MKRSSEKHILFLYNFGFLENNKILIYSFNCPFVLCDVLFLFNTHGMTEGFFCLSGNKWKIMTVRVKDPFELGGNQENGIKQQSSCIWNINISSHLHPGQCTSGPDWPKLDLYIMAKAHDAYPEVIGILFYGDSCCVYTFFLFNYSTSSHVAHVPSLHGSSHSGLK